MEGNHLTSFQGQLCDNAVENMQVESQNAELKGTGKTEEEIKTNLSLGLSLPPQFMWRRPACNNQTRAI